MSYLAASEYEQYGLEATVPEALVASASALIDSLCSRPSLGVTQYSERVRVAPGSNRTRLSYLPLCALGPADSPVVKVRVRYGANDSTSVPDVARTLSQAFGLAGSWVDLDVSQTEFVKETGEIALPAQVLGLGYIEAEITYTAGFETIPDPVKFACVQLVRNAQAAPALNVRGSGLDRMQMEYFGPSLVDETVKQLLAPFVASRCAA